MNLKSVRYFFRYLKPYVKNVFLMFILMGLNQLLSLLLPRLISKLIDVGIKKHGIENTNPEFHIQTNNEIISLQTGYILKTGIIMLSIALIIVILSIITNRINIKISAGISMDLRKDLFHKIMNLTYKDVSKFSSSSLITRVMNDVEQVQQFIVMCTQLFIPPLIMISGILMALTINVSMTILVIIGSIIAGIISFICLKIIYSKSRLLQETEDKFNLNIREQLNGITVIRSFDNKLFEKNRFNDSNSKFSEISLFINRISSIMSPLLTLSINFVTVFIMVLGAKYINNSTIQVGQVVAFGQYALMIMGSIVMISLMISTLPRSIVSLERVYEILYIENDIEVNSNTLEKLENNFKGDIELINVDYKPTEISEATLKHINLKIKHGETLGIIGTIGSGKSTLLKLIMGLYNPSEGSILFENKNLKSLDKNSLIRNISYVSQKDTVFSGTVESNLKLGNDNIDEEKMMEVLRITLLEKILDDKGLYTNIIQSGKNLSGGQKQRLTIARALLKNSNIYILDDIFSNIDFKTESIIRKSILSYLRGKTIILVSQRINTIKDLDRILVLDEGKIKGIGTHSELLKNCDIYKKMYEVQLGGEIFNG